MGFTTRARLGLLLYKTTPAQLKCLAQSAAHLFYSNQIIPTFTTYMKKEGKFTHIQNVDYWI